MTFRIAKLRWFYIVLQQEDHVQVGDHNHQARRINKSTDMYFLLAIVLQYSFNTIEICIRPRSASQVRGLKNNRSKL